MMDLDEAITFRGWKSHQDPKDVDEALEALAVEVERLRRIEAAAREVDERVRHGRIRAGHRDDWAALRALCKALSSPTDRRR